MNIIDKNAQKIKRVLPVRTNCDQVKHGYNQRYNLRQIPIRMVANKQPNTPNAYRLPAPVYGRDAGCLHGSAVPMPPALSADKREGDQMMRKIGFMNQ
jgi:hypothetical protein